MALSRRVARALRNRLVRLARARDPLAAHRGRLPAGPHRTVVVLTDGETGRAGRRWLRAFARDDVHLFATGAEPAAADEEPHSAASASASAGSRRVVTYRPGDPLAVGAVLAELGPVDVLVDLLAGTGVDHLQLRDGLFLHLRGGGTYVIGRTCSRAEFAARAGGWAERLRAPAPPLPERHIWPSPELLLARELAAATGRVTIAVAALLIGKKRDHLLKLREAALPRVLPRREPAIRYTDLETVPAGSFGPRAEVHHYGPATPQPWPAEAIDYPAMRLRHYEGRIGYAGHSLVHGAHTILPDSYHWSLADDPRNPFTDNAGPEFACIPPERRPKRDLAGNYYLLDPNYSGYGHVLTEIVPRLWGWDRAKAQIPDLKALFWVASKDAVSGDEPTFRIPKAYGIPAEDIVRTNRPAWLGSLVAPSLMWHNREPFFAHPDLVDVWARLADRLIDERAPTYERIFVARTGEYARRGCRNNDAVQRFFVERGFTVVHPELLDLGAQAAVFAGARVVAGYGGSGLFNVMFARNLETLIVLHQNSYQHRNELLYAAVLGVPVHFFWSLADISHPPGQRSFAATESPWEFDFAGNGAALSDLLAQV